LPEEQGSQRGGSNEGTPRPRIQTLSDPIFGLALYTGALSLISEKLTDLFGLADSLPNLDIQLCGLARQGWSAIEEAT